MDMTPAKVPFSLGPKNSLESSYASTNVKLPKGESAISITYVQVMWYLRPTVCGSFFFHPSVLLRASMLSICHIELHIK